MKLRHPARRLAALALSLLLLLAFLPTAFAGGETVPAGEGQAPRAGAVAKFGNTEYMKVQEAIDAAKTSGGMVRLLQDVTEYVTIDTGSVTLDLSGHTLSASDDGAARAAIYVTGGTLTIEDTAGNGEVFTSQDVPALRIAGGSVTLDGGTLRGDVGSETLVSIEGSSASLTVKDGAIRSEAKNSDNTMGMVQISNGCTLKLDGGELYSRFLHAIRNNGGGTVTMTGGSVTVDRQGAYALDNYGTAEISGGTLTSPDGGTAVHAVAEASGARVTTKLSGSVVCNGNIQVNGAINGTNANIANLEISSGTINGSVNVESYSDVTLSGGTFTGGVKGTSADNNTIRVMGGIYSQKPADVELAVALVIEADSQFYVGEDAEKRISSAQSGETLEVVHGKEVTDVPAGVTVTNGTGDDITVNGEPVAPDGSITIPAPEQPSEPSNPSFTEPQYYPDYDEDEDSLPPVDEEARDLYMVTCRTLNVRLGGGTGYARIGTLSRGTILEGELEDGWLKFPYNGQTAYCSADYLARVGGDLTDMHVTCRTLNVRAGAGTNFEILGTLSRGTEVEILDVLNGWYKIEYLGGEAYVSAAYIG